MRCCGRTRHRGCGEKWRRGGVWRALPGRRVRRMVRCLPDSPLLPTDHRDSPQTVTTSVKPVNTFTTRFRRPLQAMCGPCPDILGQARRIPLDAVADCDIDEHEFGNMRAG